MVSRISPLVRKLLRPDEEVELVVCGGYSSVREFFILTNERIVIARQLAQRLIGVTFDRDRELWMELRPNKYGVDFVVCSSDTLERIRKVSKDDLQLLRETFHLEEGDYEEMVPLPDRMYELFKGLPGSTRSEGQMSPAHYSFFIISTLLFGLLTYECGRLVGPLISGESVWGFYFPFIAALLTTLLVKSSLQIACFAALGLPMLMAGMQRNTGELPLESQSTLAIYFAGTALFLWVLASILQSCFRRIGKSRALPPRVYSVALSTVLISALIFLAVYERKSLSPFERKRFSRRVYHRTSQCKMTLIGEKEDTLLLFDDQYAIVASLRGGAKGTFEIWTHSDAPSRDSNVRACFSGELLFHHSKEELGAFDLTRGRDLWSFDFGRPVAAIPRENAKNCRFDLDMDFASRESLLRVLSWWKLSSKEKPRSSVHSTKLTVFDELTGKRQWQRTLPLTWKGQQCSSPILLDSPDDYVLVALPGLEVDCIDGTSGEALWSHPWEAGTYAVCSTPSVLTYVNGSSLEAVSLSEGKVLYKRPLPGELLWPLFRHHSGSLIAAVNDDGKNLLLFIDDLTGEVEEKLPFPSEVKDNFNLRQGKDGILLFKGGLWRFRRSREVEGAGYVLHINEDIIHPLLLGKGRLYLATKGAYIMVFNDETGKEQWRFRMQSPLSKGGMVLEKRGPIALNRLGIIHAFNR